MTLLSRKPTQRRLSEYAFGQLREKINEFRAEFAHNSPPSSACKHPENNVFLASILEYGDL